MALDQVQEGKVDVGSLIAQGKEEFSDVSPEKIADFFKSATKELRQMPERRASTIADRKIDEFQILSDASDFLKKEFDAEKVDIYMSDDSDIYDPQDRSEQSVPFKPAIFVE